MSYSFGILDKESINKVVEVEARLECSCLWETLHFSPYQKERNIPTKHLDHVPVMARSTLNLIYLVTLLLVCLDCEPFWRDRDHLAFNHKSTVPDK